MMNAPQWLNDYEKLIKQGISQRKACKELGVQRKTVQRWFKKQEGVVVGNNQQVVGNEDNSVILIISDMHIPYHHPNLIPFLKQLKEKYKPTRVVCIGDELDKHKLNYHEHNPDLPSAGDELKLSLEVVSKLYELFPKMDILESNHGSLVYRKAKTGGIPKHYLKTYNEVLSVGDGWKWHFDLIINLPNSQKVYFHHGKSSDGLKLSQTMGMNCVQGHYHERFGINYWANPLGLYWSMQVGCLIEDSSLAFAYNNVNLKRPIIGCGLIVNGQPVLESMKL